MLCVNMHMWVQVYGGQRTNKHVPWMLFFIVVVFLKIGSLIDVELSKKAIGLSTPEVPQSLPLQH